MNEPFQLVTNCSFKGKDYLVQMCVLNSKKLELIVTDKLMAEDWQCEYDASYIEALTHKTGNFKQFDVFVMMLKSGLLKTSECITLDLLTLEDLEELRNKKIINSYSSSSRSSQNRQSNKRYLILTYSVEFDRIHYPLPLDYCGPPNPSVLQSNIRRLEAEVEHLKQKNISLSKSDEGETKKLKEKIKSVIEDNTFLSNEVHRLNKMLSKRDNPGKKVQVLQSSLKKLEERVSYEKRHNQQTVHQLKVENKQLTKQVEELKKRENVLKLKLKDALSRISRRDCTKSLKSYLSPDHSGDRKRRAPVDRSESLLFQPDISCNSSTITKSKKCITSKRKQNRFLSSSSSESEAPKSSKGRSREVVQSTIARQPLYSKFSVKSMKSREVSNERSRHSSEDSKGKPQSNHSLKTSIKRSNSQEGKSDNSHRSRGKFPQAGVRSRESSLSSRGSSKHSKVSRFSNRGSGDHQVNEKKPSHKTFESNKEDVKFSMSDLESRIHALQRLLSDGLNF